MLTPFDLHVLSTPPAFILSQDQTLLFYSGHSKLGFSFFTAFLGLFRSFFFLSLKSFRCLSLARLTYHASGPLPLRALSLRFRLESSQLRNIFRAALLFICQGPMLLSHRFPARQLCYLITPFLLCQALFSFFLHFFLYLVKKTEKEGFEPSRRSPDLHP